MTSNFRCLQFKNSLVIDFNQIMALDNDSKVGGLITNFKTNDQNDNNQRIKKYFSL